MKLFISPDDHSRALIKLANKNPKHVFIASYGVYCGISYAGQDTTKWGEKFKSATKDLLEHIRLFPDVKLLIGIANYTSCKEKSVCADCERQYCKVLIRLLNHAEFFPEFEWRVTTNLHLKAYLFFYENSTKGIGGGRNLTNSDWVDCSFELNNANIKMLYNHIKKTWDDSKIISDTTISEILEEQKISPNSL